MKSRTSSGNVMEGTQPLQMGGRVNPNCWSIRPLPPVNTITSHQQQHHPSYNLLHHPLNNNNFFPFNPPNSIALSPYSPQPTSSSNSSSWHDQHDNNQHQHPQDHHQQLPSEAWSQLLIGEMDQDEVEKQSAAATTALTQQLQTAAANLKMHNWVLQIPPQQHFDHESNYESNSTMDIKQEHNVSIPSSCYNNMFSQGNEELAVTTAWSSIVMLPNSSPPKSCVTSYCNNSTNSFLDFSSNNKGDGISRHPAPEHTSESNSSATGGAAKKARVQATPSQSNTMKVRKEKLGDRITALHQLVSPFGKTDTASVLLETMGCIRFLHSKIEALSLPYLSSGGGSGHQQQPHMHNSTEKHLKKDLKSRGLCLVPVSCTLQVGSDNGADYWAPPPAIGGGFH